MSLKPIKEKVYLKNLGKDVTLNFFTLQDDEDLEDKFGGPDELNRRFSAFDLDVMLTIFWMLMDNQSKEMISKANLVVWEGLEQVTLKTTDPVEKLKRIIAGSSEIISIYGGILGSRNSSNPELSEIDKRKKLVGSP